jgi:hypothetical protein
MSESNGTESNVNEDDPSTRTIADPRETDVLCGRGGAALRHPGNQTYRRLVNLNKSLYITCPKTEKLKISRSIVAAIREQQGRFLERDAKDQTWYDIGDKKAIEKTSQALREGQPKLRQKMIDNGQIAASHAANMETQFGNGIYQAGSRPPSIGAASVASVGSMMSQFSMGSLTGPNALQLPTSFQGNMDMPPPPARTMSTEPMAADALMQRLSLSSAAQQPGSIPSWTPSLTRRDCESLSMRSARMRMSQQSNGFVRDNAMSIMSDLSGFAYMQDGSMFTDGSGGTQNSMLSNIFGFPGQNMAHLTPPLSPPGNNNYDRRRLFAKMKLAKEGPPSRATSQRTDADGMPDIHMVDSQFSLLSNLSGHGSSRHARTVAMPDMMNISGHGLAGLSNLSGHRGGPSLSGLGFSSNNSGHESMFGDNAGLGSRRSLMSGLSKISDHSSGSVFSDLSRKINLPLNSMSNRSVAMSEISGVDEEDDESDDGEFAYDVGPGATNSDR